MPNANTSLLRNVAHRVSPIFVRGLLRERLCTPLAAPLNSSDGK